MVVGFAIRQKMLDPSHPQVQMHGSDLICESLGYNISSESPPPPSGKSAAHIFAEIDTDKSAVLSVQRNSRRLCTNMDTPDRTPRSTNDEVSR